MLPRLSFTSGFAIGGLTRHPPRLPSDQLIEQKPARGQSERIYKLPVNFVCISRKIDQNVVLASTVQILHDSGGLILETQSYSNHARIVFPYHRVLFPVLLLTLIGALVNLYQSIGDHQRLYSASLILVLTGCLTAVALYARIFALKAQDRAIRAEENLRHFVLTGKLLDPRLSVRQIVGLRFASDGEFVSLAQRAINEGLSPDDIKKAVKDWRADDHRA